MIGRNPTVTVAGVELDASYFTSTEVLTMEGERQGVACSTCGAKPGEPCRSLNKNRPAPQSHKARRNLLNRSKRRVLDDK